MIPYTGVGSRKTPSEVLTEFRWLARTLAVDGFALRSGGAPGADMAFEAGARDAPGATAEIYLPWKGFNGNHSPLYVVDEPALQLAATVHPAWERCSDAARRLHARDCYQVLGRQLNTPSAFLVCWTPDGCESQATRTTATGGTATAIVLAERNGIPVFNYRNAGRRSALSDHLQKLRSSPE